MLENARRHIQVQPETIPIGGVYYPYSQWDNTIEINRIHYEVDWVGLSQTSFGHISINSPSILTVSMATESP